MPVLKPEIHYHPETGIHETIFANGLKLLTVERRHLPIATVMTWYRVGGRHATPGLTGVAHLVEHMMFKGTTKFAKGDIDLLTQKMGGSNNAFTSSDYTCYHFDCPADSWQSVLAIEAERMINCKWDKDEFASEKSVILEELGASEDSPIESLSQQAETLCYERHSYRYPILGWREDIEHLTLEKAYAYYRQYYRPDTACIVLVGDIETAAVVAAVTELFSHIPQSNPPAQPVFYTHSAGEQKRLYMYHEVELPRFAWLFPSCVAGSFDDCVLDLLDILLSGGREARLYRRLVQDNALLQKIYTTNDCREQPGIYWILGSLCPGVSLYSVEQALDEELRKLASHPPGVHELQRAKNVFLSHFLLEQESNSDLAEQIGEAEIYGGYRRLADVPRTIQAIRGGQVSETVRRYLQLKQATLAWSLPKNKPLPAPNRRRFLQKPRAATALPHAVTSRKIIVSNLLQHNSETEPILRADGSLDIHRQVMANGLTVLVLQNRMLPFAVMELRCRECLDIKGKEGTGNLLGRLFLEGTHKQSAEQIAHTVEFLGANISAGANGLSARCFSHDVDIMLGLIAEMIASPKLDAAAMRREKKQMLAHVISRRDSPYQRAREAFCHAVYGVHPYSRNPDGNAASITSITRQDIAAYLHRYFVPNQMILAVVGDVNPQRIFALAEEKLGCWQATQYKKLEFPPVALARKSVTRFIAMSDKQQVVVYWGHLGIRRNNPDFPALIMLDHILGEGVGLTDRLSARIRDELGLCYAIHCSITANTGIEPGTLAATLSTSAANYTEAMRLLQEEMDKIRQKPVANAELEDAKNYITRSFMFGLEENTQIVHLLLKMEVFSLGFTYIGSLLQQIRQLTRDDLRRVAQQYIHPEVAATIAVGAVEGLRK